MIAIIDYGVGNLFSLESSFRCIGAEVCVTSSPEKIAAADRIILPGVGAFEDAAKKLRESGLDKAYDHITLKKIPQMLLSRCEFGKTDYNLNIVHPPVYEDEEDIDE